MRDGLDEAVDIDLTAIMRREGIEKIELFPVNRILVRLTNQKVGVGQSVRAALKQAKEAA